MPSTLHIRRRIKSVKNTAKITKAMQMVAASKMKRAQNAAIAGRPYAELMNRIMASLHHAEKEERLNPFLMDRENKTPGVLLISTDKGLCGPLNSNVFRQIDQFAKNAQFVTIGRRGRQYLARTGRQLVADFPLKDDAGPLQIKQVSQFMMDLYLEEKIDSITVLFNHFENTLRQEPRAIPVIPIQELFQVRAGVGLRQEDYEERMEPPPNEYAFEPNPRFVLDKLLPYYIHFQIYQMVLDQRASEHSARMVAMKSATDNANQIVKELTLQYNKIRQASITNELLDITTAQMALS